MNLLVFNIRTDADHPTQGVTTKWLNKLADHFDHISVITMHKGRIDLKDNIDVYSIGGELGYSRIKKTINFYKLLNKILRQNNIYGCFTHMAVLFILMGGPILALRKIPRVTWYAHSVINPVMIISYFLSNAVITASPDSFRIMSPKVYVTGHGIDTEHYSKHPSPPNSLFTIGSVGRITKYKHYETLLKAGKLLMDDGIDSFQIKLYGNIQTRDDEKYMGYLDHLVKGLGLGETVDFAGPLTGEQVPAVVSHFDVFVNMLSKGGAGKAVLEAMSMEVPTIICTPAFNRYLSKEDRDKLIFKPNDPKSLKEKLKRMMKITGDERIELGKNLRNIVLNEHSLDNLALKIKNAFLESTGEALYSKYFAVRHDKETMTKIVDSIGISEEELLRLLNNLRDSLPPERVAKLETPPPIEQMGTGARIDEPHSDTQVRDSEEEERGHGKPFKVFISNLIEKLKSRIHHGETRNDKDEEEPV